MVRRVARLFRPYRMQVGLVLASILVTGALGVAPAFLTKAIINRALLPHDLHLLWQLVVLMIAIPLVSGAIGIGQTYLTTVVGQRVMQDLRNRLYEHLQAMSLRFFTGARTGELQSRLQNDVGGVQNVVTNTVSSILSSVVTVLSTLVAMLLLSWQLTALSFAVVPVFVYLTWRVGRARRALSKSTEESLAELSALTEETLSVSGVLLAKTFDRQRDAVERYREVNRRLAWLNVRQQMVGRSFFALVQTFFAASPALIYLVAGYSNLSLGTIVAFTTLQTRLLFPIGSLLQTAVEVQSSLALFERIFAYLDLEIEPGQLAAIVGPSGAGKTTISYLVPRLYDVTRGAVRIDGIDVREIKLASLAEIVGMVTQETYLFHSSVRENLLYARPDATHAEVEAATRAAAIHDRITELSEGYDTLVGERGYRMSGGEKQRLAIARVILKDPRILILDEATSALDTTSERLVQEALRPLMRGRTTIAIAHRLSTILSADVIFVVDRGRIVERGTHAELLGRGGLYARLYEQQFRGGEVEAECEDGVVMASGEVVRTPSWSSGFPAGRPAAGSR